MEQKDINAVLAEHALWLADGRGSLADLRRANLCGADLRGANLRGANLCWADLRWANLRGADLSEADLSEADLREADLRGANLRGADLSWAVLDSATGNMREVKTAQFDRWSVAWVTNAAGVVTLQIGCQRHKLDLWVKSGPRWIKAMDTGAEAWWAKYRDIILALVAASPAIPHGGTEGDA